MPGANLRQRAAGSSLRSGQAIGPIASSGRDPSWQRSYCKHRIRHRTRGVAVAGSSLRVLSGPAIRLCCGVEADTASGHAYARSSRRARSCCAPMIPRAGLAPDRSTSRQMEFAPYTRYATPVLIHLPSHLAANARSAAAAVRLRTERSSPSEPMLGLECVRGHESMP